MTTEKPTKTYFNAGAQTAQARMEVLKYWDAPDEDFFTVKCISEILGINRNKVNQIPVARIMIDKRGYYRKGDIRKWMEAERSNPDSLLLKLIDEQNIAKAKIKKQPSRRYNGSPISAVEAKEAKEKSKITKLTEPDAYEAHMHPWLIGVSVGKKIKKPKWGGGW